MSNISRREALTSLAAASGGLSLSHTLAAETNQQTVQSAPTRAFRAQHQPQPLTFNPAKLSGLSERLIRSHWENNYGGSVKALNAVELRLDALLKEKDLPAYVYGDLKREELHRTGSVVLHEHYFGNLGGDGKSGGEIAEQLKQWFGSFEAWQAEYKKTAAALAGGSGWAILAYNYHTQEIHNYWAWDHMHNAPASVPLLVLDMYEHSYHMDYGAAAAKYIDAFMQNVNWELVNNRWSQARKIEAALKST